MSRAGALVLLVLLVGACVSPRGTQDNVPVYWHDDAHAVSCWLFGKGGGSYTAALSCLPDSQVKR